MSLNSLQTIVITMVLFMATHHKLSYGKVLTCEEVNMNTEGHYHVAHHNGSCYLFVLEEKTMRNGWQLCRDMGGFLTDVSEDTRTFFKDYVASFNETKYSTSLKNTYTVGYIYCSALGGWYWDTGLDRHISLKYEERNYFSPDDYYHCAKVIHPDYQMRSYICENELHPFICKLAPSSTFLTGAANDTCSLVCREVNKSFKSMLQRLTTLAPTTPSANFTGTSSATSGPSETTDANKKQTNGKKTDGSEITGSCEDDDDGIVMLAVLAVSGILNVCLIVFVLYLKCCSKPEASSKEEDRSDMIELQNLERRLSNRNAHLDSGGSQENKMELKPENGAGARASSNSESDQAHGGVYIGPIENTYYTCPDSPDGVVIIGGNDHHAHVGLSGDDRGTYQNQTDLGVAKTEAKLITPTDYEEYDPKEHSESGKANHGEGTEPTYYSKFGTVDESGSAPVNVYGMESASEPFIE